MGDYHRLSGGSLLHKYSREFGFLEHGGCAGHLSVLAIRSEPVGAADPPGQVRVSWCGLGAISLPSRPWRCGRRSLCRFCANIRTPAGARARTTPFLGARHVGHQPVALPVVHDLTTRVPGWPKSSSSLAQGVGGANELALASRPLPRDSACCQPAGRPSSSVRNGVGHIWTRIAPSLL